MKSHTGTAIIGSPADVGVAEVSQGGNGGERGAQDEASAENDTELREQGGLVGSR